MKEYWVDRLRVVLGENRNDLGKIAAVEISNAINETLSQKQYANIIFAAAPSQNETLAALCEDHTIAWDAINAFHMDEYAGLNINDKQSFARFLSDAIFSRKPFHSVNLIDGKNNIEDECVRYGRLLAENPPDIVVMGIGENGHIAFNDPGVADFHDCRIIKKVELDDVCRIQQVHDGCFSSIDAVPRYALTLTVPTLAKAKYQFCQVPSKTKAVAVKNTLFGSVCEECPATVLRTLNSAVMFLEPESAKLVESCFKEVNV